MDSTITAFITLILALQATNVRAGKIVRENVSTELYVTERGRSCDRLGNSVTDDGDCGINRFTWTQRRHVCFLSDFPRSTNKVVTGIWGNVALL